MHFRHSLRKSLCLPDITQQRKHFYGLTVFLCSLLGSSWSRFGLFKAIHHIGLKGFSVSQGRVERKWKIVLCHLHKLVRSKKASIESKNIDFDFYKQLFSFQTGPYAYHLCIKIKFLKASFYYKNGTEVISISNIKVLEYLLYFFLSRIQYLKMLGIANVKDHVAENDVNGIFIINA